MKRYLRYVVAAAAIGAIAALSAIAMGASGQKATGDLWWYNPSHQLVHGTFDAQPTTSGVLGSAKGQVSVWVYDHTGSTLQWSYTGDVTYYSQSGNQACFSGTITSHYGTNPSGFTWYVEDNGEGANADSSDGITALGSSSGSCTPGGTYYGTFYAGNIQVHQ